MNLLPLFLDNMPVGDRVWNNITSGRNSGGGVFKGLVDNSLASGQEIHGLVTLIGLYGGVLMLICGFIAYMVSNKGQSREAAKKKIVWLFVGIVGVLLSCYIVTAIYNAGRGL